jgi:hypothetical protein
MDAESTHSRTDRLSFGIGKREVANIGPEHTLIADGTVYRFGRITRMDYLTGFGIKRSFKPLLWGTCDRLELADCRLTLPGHDHDISWSGAVKLGVQQDRYFALLNKPPVKTSFLLVVFVQRTSFLMHRIRSN